MLSRLSLYMLTITAVAILGGCASDDDDDDGNTTVVSAPDSRVLLGVLGRYNTGLFDAGGAEIPAFCPITDRVFVVNAGPGTVDVINLSDPTSPTLITSIDCSQYANAGAPNSVAVHNGVLAIAIENGTKTDSGVVVFFSTSETVFDTSTDLNVVTVGALPDMVAFTPDGNFALVANEGEPKDDYTIDPEGSISVINLSGGVAGAAVSEATFTGFNSQKAALIAAGVRIFGPESSVDEPDDIATVAQDLEPEYITCNNTTAWVTLQENNALAIVDIATATVTAVVPLGYKDHSMARNALDPTNSDGQILLMTGPVRGLYMPDSIASYTVNGQTFLVTANEGDARDYAGYSEESRISGLTLDPTAFPGAAALQQNNSFGRLNSTTASGDTDGDGDHDVLYSYGARSFSIWNSTGQLVWDSGDDFERITAAALPLHFNASNTGNALDNRSDDKGPEPEAIALGEIGGRWYAFVGLERVGGIMVYDITVPGAPFFQTYVNTRDFSVSPAGNGVGNPVDGLDVGPEGIVFVPATDSPNGRALLIVAHEISGSTTVFEVTKLFE